MSAKLPLDIVKKILSYDYRFVIRNGEIIVINQISKDDTRYILLKSIPYKIYDNVDDITQVIIKITETTTLFIDFYGAYERNRLKYTYVYYILVDPLNSKNRTKYRMTSPPKHYSLI